MNESRLKVAALTIAGSDSCGGAGIQADLAAFHELGVYGASAITALTAQNTLGVSAVQTISAHLVQAQLHAVFEDLPIRAVKTGMLANAEIIAAVADFLDGKDVQLIVDPVMIATSGARLLDEDAIVVLRDRLLPRATLVTPNLPEARLLAGVPTATDPHELGHSLLRAGSRAVLIKGGHSDGEMVEDWLFTPDQARSWRHSRRAGQIHGTGCRLSAGITAGVALGLSLPEAVAQASTMLQQAMANARRPLAGDLWLLGTSGPPGASAPLPQAK